MRKRIQLPMLYGSHMMLQREKTLTVSGTADPDVKKIRLEISGREIRPELSAGKGCREDPGGAVFSFTAGTDVRDGVFSLQLPPLPAAEDGSLCFYVNGEEQPELCFEDVCIGDLWMACGQSNMEYFLRYDADWNRTKRLVRNPRIRMFNVPRLAFPGEVKDISDSGFWFGEGDEAWHTFSAPGYAFARTLAPQLDIPVGIIGCNWGGTPACAWMAEEYYAEAPLDVFRREYEAEVAKYTPERLRELSEEALAYENSYSTAVEWQAMMYGMTEAEQEQWMAEHASAPQIPMGPWHHYRPSGLYHNMLKKAAPFGIRGFLWYQGESDSGHADIYDRTMEALVRCFRDTWQDPDLPFLYVQLAPFGRWLECTGDNYTEVREAQERAMSLIPDAWMASIMDLGCYEDIHPKFKMEVGRRLALLALGHVYGRDVLCDPPAAAEAEAVLRETRTGEAAPGEGNCPENPGVRQEHLLLRLKISPAGEGLVSDGRPGEAFEITRRGAEMSIRSARIEGEYLFLELEEETAAGTHGGAHRETPAEKMCGEEHSETDGGGQPDTIVVRYAMRDYCETHLWNSAGLAVRPFRIEVPVRYCT